MIRILPTAAMIVALAGCTTKPSQGPSAPGESTVRTDPWPVAAATLRKQPDLGGARQAISTLVSGLADNPAAESPKPMPEEAARKLGELLALSPEELKDVSGTNYTNLDAAYIAECLLFRDAIRSLDLGQLSAERKAKIVFDWVCRMIYRRQGIVIQAGGPALSPPLPPQFSLFRGYGSGLDRAYTFLAAVQQLGLDGCLIGPPDRDTEVSIKVENNKASKGPFWAVGVRTPEGSILLFDPWRGAPFPGPNGTIGTIAQLAAGAGELRAWIEDKANPWDVTESDLKNATVYLAYPFPATSARMKMFEEQVATEVGVKLHRDPVELQSRFGTKARFWHPSFQQDRFCITRGLASFLPTEEGGTDESPAKELRLYDQITKLSTIPIELFEPPPEITAKEIENALKAFFLKRFSEIVVEGHPRERICRGQFNEVIRNMVDRERLLNAARERGRLQSKQGQQENSVLPNLPEDAVARWAEKANELYQRLSLARLPQNQADLPDAQAAVDQLWEKGGPVVQLIEDRRVVPICAVEIGYLLAICKHEQAERAGIRLSRTTPNDTGRAAATASAREAWLVAKDAWDRYFAALSQLKRYDADKSGHAQQLAVRAGRLAANPVESEIP